MYKPVLKQKDALTYVSDADMIKFISTNAPMDWNECCKFVRKNNITSDGLGGGNHVYWDKDILKNPKNYNENQVKWIGAFFEAHPFIESMMIVFDD